VETSFHNDLTNFVLALETKV